jgi:hypothetical protein
MSFQQDGGCQCGAVRYRINAKPGAVTLCHCTYCQQQTGSAFSMAMFVPDGAFVLLQGQLKTWVRRSDSGRTVTTTFCPECGTRITGRSELYKGFVNVRPGTLDDRSWLQPTGSYWTREKQPWLKLQDGLKVHETQPDLAT